VTWREITKGTSVTFNSIMIGHRSGAEIRQPLGYAMVGGLIVSQMTGVTPREFRRALQ
jgi:multidrug efflux pump subunit AcrB